MQQTQLDKKETGSNILKQAPHQKPVWKKRGVDFLKDQYKYPSYLFYMSVISKMLQISLIE